MRLITHLLVMKAKTMKLDKYTQHTLEGPYQPSIPTLADKVLFWLSGFVAGFVLSLLIWS